MRRYEYLSIYKKCLILQRISKILANSIKNIENKVIVRNYIEEGIEKLGEVLTSYFGHFSKQKLLIKKRFLQSCPLIRAYFINDINLTKFKLKTITLRLNTRNQWKALKKCINISSWKVI